MVGSCVRASSLAIPLRWRSARSARFGGRAHRVGKPDACLQQRFGGSEQGFLSLGSVALRVDHFEIAGTAGFEARLRLGQFNLGQGADRAIRFQTRRRGGDRRPSIMDFRLDALADLALLALLPGYCGRVLRSRKDGVCGFAHAGADHPAAPAPFAGADQALEA